MDAMKNMFLISVPIFSVIFSYSSFLPLLLHYCNFSSTAISLRLFGGISVDKNYMFLLCNGILAFIVKNSGLVDNSKEGRDFNGRNSMENRDFPDVMVEVKGQDEEEIKEMGLIVAKKKETEEEKTEELDLVVVEKNEEEEEEEEEEKTGELSLIAAERNEEEESKQLDLIGSEDQKEEEDGSLSREEFNRKCDDFIRMMRETIKSGAKTPISS